jgi:hypothetical protein
MLSTVVGKSQRSSSHMALSSYELKDMLVQASLFFFFYCFQYTFHLVEAEVVESLASYVKKSKPAEKYVGLYGLKLEKSSCQTISALITY